MEQIPAVIHESWHSYLQPLFDNSKMALLKNKILPATKFYPTAPDIFRVFGMPMNQIRAVVLGQDPYSNGEAIGFSFAVNRTTRIPKSLDIIRKEIINSKVERDTYINIDSDRWRELGHWRAQGIFLLNTALTVEFKVPNSHVGYWEWFTKEVIKIISAEITPIWMLWGAKAIAYEQLIIGSEKFKVNSILKAPHPAAETYSGGKGATFTGCNHFNLCNEILKKDNDKIINW